MNNLTCLLTQREGKEMTVLYVYYLCVPSSNVTTVSNLYKKKRFNRVCTPKPVIRSKDTPSTV